MDLSKILSISGKGGLFKIISQAKNAVIVESLLDGKRYPAFSHDKISSLEEISVFSTGDDIPLKEIFRSIFIKLEGKAAPDYRNDSKALKSFFQEMVPEYDKERVYISDMKKMVIWYNLLLSHHLIDNEDNKPVADNPETIETDPQPEQENSAGGENS